MSETLKTRAGRVVELPANAEDARINLGIAADPDSPELDEAWFERARPAAEVLPQPSTQICWPCGEGLASAARRRRQRSNALLCVCHATC